MRAAERVLSILAFMAREERVDWTLEEVASGTELPKSTTHRLLDTAVRQRFVEVGARPGTYRLGLRAAIVGTMAIRARQPKREVHEVLEAVVAELGESAGIWMRDGARVVLVDRVASLQPLHWNRGVGASVAAHCSAAGKVLYGDLPDEEIRALYGAQTELPRMTESTIGSVDELVEHVRERRALGYAIDDEELELGVRCVSVPVRGPSGRMIYALSAAAPAARLGRADLEAMVDPLRRAAETMSPHVDLIHD